MKHYDIKTIQTSSGIMYGTVTLRGVTASGIMYGTVTLRGVAASGIMYGTVTLRGVVADHLHTVDTGDHRPFHGTPNPGRFVIISLNVGWSKDDLTTARTKLYYHRSSQISLLYILMGMQQYITKQVINYYHIFYPYFTIQMQHTFCKNHTILHPRDILYHNG